MTQSVVPTLACAGYLRYATHFGLSRFETPGPVGSTARYALNFYMHPIDLLKIKIQKSSKFHQ
jgi:hypothetical protein